MIAPLLDHQPDILAPRAALQRIRGHGAGRTLAVNRHLRFEASAQGLLVHVGDPERGLERSFTLSTQTWSILRVLRPGMAAPAMDPFMQTVLVDAGILVDGAAAAAADADAAADMLAAAHRSFADAGYGIVTDALHPYEVAAVRRYIRHGVRTGAMVFGDPQVPKRYRAHNDPVLRSIQGRLLPLIRAVVGVAVKPSYAYLAAYAEGAVLHRHVDRPQCAYSMTLLVDYTPEPALESAWPIRLALPDAEALVYQSLGDALVYAGTRLVHFRDPLPAGHTSTSLLLHYVPSDFTGDLD
jgi:hypothetical protein